MPSKISKTPLSPVQKRRQAVSHMRLEELVNFREMVGWKYNEKPSNLRQSVTPFGKKLARDIGIAPKSKVLVFAGFSGDWARALAQTCEVHYTDASKEITSKIRRYRRGKITSFKAVPSHLKPQRPKIYDWSFSFEPYPIHEIRGVLRKTIARALLNNKGLKLVYSFDSSLHLKAELGLISDVYGAKVFYKKARLKRELNGKIRFVDVFVATLLTNASARKSAWLDFRVLNLMDKGARGIEVPERKSLSKSLRVSDGELKASIMRVNNLFQKGSD